VVLDDKTIQEMARFARVVKLTAFSPFKMPENALSHMTKLTDGWVFFHLRQG